MVDAPENKMSFEYGAVIRRFEYDRSKVGEFLALVTVLAGGALWFVLDPRPILVKSAGTVQVISAIALTVFFWEIFRLVLILVRRLPVLVVTTRGLIVPRPWTRLKLLGWSDIAEVSEGAMAVVVRPVDRRRLLINTSIIDDISSPFRTEHIAREIREARRSFGPA